MQQVEEIDRVLVARQVFVAIRFQRALAIAEVHQRLQRLSAQGDVIAQMLEDFTLAVDLGKLTGRVGDFAGEAPAEQFFVGISLVSRGSAGASPSRDAFFNGLLKGDYPNGIIVPKAEMKTYSALRQKAGHSSRGIQPRSLCVTA